MVKALTYDAVNSVLNETGVLESAFIYDANSNRSTQLLNGETTDYSYALNTNQLTQVGEINLILDAAGNTLSDGARSFTYNDRNQLETFSQSGNGIAVYEYNFGNLRTQKNLDNGENHIYRYDLQGRRIQDSISGQSVTSTIYLGWKPVAHIQHAANGDIDSITYLTGDQIDTPRLGTDQNQNVVWRWEVDAFGSTEPETNPDGDTRVVNIENRFAGQYADSESGLRYNWHRYYDQTKGRYISSDPIGLDSGLNTYLYSYANPLKYIDPTGEFNIVGAIGGAALEVGVQAFTQLSANGFRFECVSIDFADVAIAGIAGGLFPGAGKVFTDLVFPGKVRKARKVLKGQLGRARTENKRNKISRRVKGKNNIIRDTVGGAVAGQVVTRTSKALFDAPSGGDDCECKN